MRIATLPTRTLAAAAVCALVLAACGSGAHGRAPARGAGSAKQARGAKRHHHDDRTVIIYSSLPLNGPQRVDSLQIEAGINLALYQTKHSVGSYPVRYEQLNDATRRQRGWNPIKTVNSAETAARNPRTVAFIGDLDSGATELSLPILNQAGIVQITPGSGYPGLTDDVSAKGVKITGPNEPGKYYPQPQSPQSPHTLLRLIPNDLVQAAAAIDLLHRGGCHAVGVWQLGGGSEVAEATALANAVRATAPLYGMSAPAVPVLGKHTKDYESYAIHLKDKIGCAVLSGGITPAAVDLTTELHAQLGLGLPIVGTGGLCNAAWTDARRGGVPARYVGSLYCTTPLRPLSHYSGGAIFAKAFRTHFHRKPSTYAYYGYQAAEIVLTAVHSLGDGLDNRAVMREELLRGEAYSRALGGGFDLDGNLESTAYAIDKVVNGTPRWYETLTPPYVLAAGAGPSGG